MKGLGMYRGMGLVELMISLAISSILILALYTAYTLFSKNYLESRDGWYCMQSLRSTIIQIDADLKQSACLMPQDMKVACGKDSLFIAGVPHTSSHSGLKLHASVPPPYFSVMRPSSGTSIMLDTVDIDSNSVPDYWADLGIITDTGPYVIAHRYSRGNLPIPLTTRPAVVEGGRSIPAIHYELKDDGLYRNGQLLAEAISSFDAKSTGTNITISLKASHHGEQRQITYTYMLE